MWITQSYARPSAAVMDDYGLSFQMSAEQHRPPVALKATIRDSAAYARAMLALFAVVGSDGRFKSKDHSAYQAWVQARYLEELAPEFEARRRALPGQMQQRDALRLRISELEELSRPHLIQLRSADLWSARVHYWKWLARHNRDLWWILDPVVSVHPDGVIFEVFSVDESSYGRVTVPFDKLDTVGETVFGTTNVDFSDALADELRRVRPYRPARLEVEGGGVAIGTDVGSAFEKKIDLPPSWVRGFLQVQSAAALPGVELTLSAATVADILAVLHERREKESPRSLRFVLTPGEMPKIVIEPWNIEIRESTQIYNGEFTGEIRIWGRRRLFTLEGMLPHGALVGVKLLGTGMPSFWSVEQDGHRFDIGLSGWTQNDWSRAARFDLLAATSSISEGDVELAAQRLTAALRLTPLELAEMSDLSRDAATSALQQLCREGRAMYDIATNVYRWRELFPAQARAVLGPEDPKLAYARRIVAAGGVKWLREGQGDNDFGRSENATRLYATVRGLNTEGTAHRERKFDVTIDVDADGRVVFAQCTCAEFRRNGLKQGPCSHILAASALASRQIADARTVASTGSAGTGGGGSAALALDRFKDQNWVFTGALKLFTREQAEALVQQGGGKTAGGVSRHTSYLVAGERAGTKLLKARLFGVPVLTEQQFKAILEGKTVEEAISGGGAE
jgi:hypothetical protein